MSKRPRIVLWDIETTHNIVATFRLWGEEYIPHENVLQERYVVCACWKVLGEKQVHSVATTDDLKRFKANPHDDRHVVETLHKVASEADVLVAHNGDAYDVKFLKGRAIAHGLAPLPPLNTIDTKKVAKARFLFNSNRLDYLGRYLGVGQKSHTSPGLWLRVIQGDARAVKEMVAYNKQDVLLLEAVFNKLRPHMPEHVNRKLYSEWGDCPRCGSNHVKSNGYRATATRLYQRLQCLDCGGWFKGEAVAKANGRAQ